MRTHADAIPGAEVGQAYQTFDFMSGYGRLVSEVDLEVRVPGLVLSCMEKHQQ
jgi:hypothetical protein